MQLRPSRLRTGQGAVFFRHDEHRRPIRNPLSHQRQVLAALASALSELPPADRLRLSQWAARVLGSGSVCD
jgi:hypothetical protein